MNKSKEINKPIIIPLSFKNNIDDIQLYNWVLTHSNKSGFIKDILRQAQILKLDKNI